MDIRIAFSLALLGAALLVMGSLFKFLHWPGANIQVLAGALVLSVGLVALAINVARGRACRGVVE